MKKRLLYLLLIMIVAYFGCNEDGTLITPNDEFPKIDTLTATPDTIHIGTETTLICAASDADKDSLTIFWKSASGSFPNGQLGASVKWKAPDTAGTYKIIAAVLDSKNVVSDTVIVTALYIEAPVQLAPVNGAVDVALPVTFEWNAPNGAASYTLQVSTDSLFTSLIFNQSSLTGTTQQVTSFNNLTKYYWRVNASNSYGASLWSNVFSFRSIGTAPDSITLLSPANNATDVTIPPTLIWNASNGALSYTLQVSTSSNFATFIYNQSGLTGTSQQVTGINSLTQYYWRVSAGNNYGTSKWSIVYTFTTTGTEPAIPILTSPANNATDVTLPPTLIWNASNGAASYTLQVSTSSNFATFVYNQSGLTGTSQQLTGLNNLTQYYWRVSATNNYGTSDWSVVYTFTTTGTEPAIPILTSPANNATDVTLPPTLIWNASNGAASYTLQVSTVSNFATLVYNQSGLTGTSQQVTGLNNLTQYYWRVSASNNYGTSNWSVVYTFTTTGTALEVPTLVSPANNATSIAPPATLTWNTVSGAAGYTLQVSTDINFAAFVYNQSGLTGTSQQVTGLNNLTQYYWRVSAANNYGTSNWSVVYIFTTIGTGPATPTLASPANNATDVTIPPILIWNTVSGAAGYTLQVSTDINFAAFVYNQSGLTGTSQQVTGLNNLTQYYWRVSATNNYGTSHWAIVYTYTTIGTAPEVPTLVSPANNATGIALPAILTWNTVSGAASYTLQVSTVSNFAAFVYDQSGLTGTSQQVTGLNNLTQYYWRVSAANSYGISDWSSVYNFATIAGTFTCGESTVNYLGKIYNTVIIGSQCWLKENLNVGTRINGSQNQTNNSTIEKYCYDNNEANCNIYGGLYQWNEAMQYSTAPGNRGICPPEWHIPTNAEFQILAAAVNYDGNALKAIGQGTGSGQGTNTSGFSALLAGYRHGNGGFGTLSYDAYFWSSTEDSSTYARYMYLYYYTAIVSFDHYSNKEYGFSARCVKD